MFEKEAFEKEAREYAIGRTYPWFGTNYITNFVLREVEEAFLAGIEACKPKWHDLRKKPNDLPKRNNELTDTSDVIITDKGIAHYNFREQKWYVHNFECDMSFSESVIAWCEIPKFKK